MFNARFWPNRFFANRYWADIGAEAAISQIITEVIATFKTANNVNFKDDSKSTSYKPGIGASYGDSG